MTSLAALWLPILLSAVIVFVASSIIHMALPWHRSDYKRLANEDAFMDSVRSLGVPPGDYIVPLAGSMQAMKSPEFQEKMNKGPIMVMTVSPPGPPSMGRSLVLWFLYSIVIAIFAGYIASRALPPGAHYLKVFRFVGATAFLGYALGLWQFWIWYRRSLLTTIKGTIDGLLYGLLMAGTFGWLWPH